MSEAFSINREFDFVRLDGLRRATGRPQHEWDLYIVKELVDNALDADEVLWFKDTSQPPRIQIKMEYVPVPKLQSQFLSVQVNNRKLFPIELLEDIFNTKWYTSRKAFLKGLTRGALGNALKTLLGIPYALRNPGGWEPATRPLTIRCNETEYLPRYVIDPTDQKLSFTYESKPSRAVEGTVISVNLDHFEREKPRQVEDIELLAELYHLSNPHAQFSWIVVMSGQRWTRQYPADPDWKNKFGSTAPVHWYSLPEFQDVLAALYREHCSNEEDCRISVDSIIRFFTDNEAREASNSMIVHTLGQDTLKAPDIEGPIAMKLYQTLYQSSPGLDSMKLGCIGMEHVQAAITAALPVEGNVFYDIGTSDDPDMPFIIEAAAAYLRGDKPQLWTAINFSPTYDDPFRNRWLHAPIQPYVPVLGLRGLIDAYGLQDNATPIVLFVHLICPKIEHLEFSKTEVNHLPFKQVLGDVLNRLLISLKNGQEEKELQLKKRVYQALDTILGELSINERFILDQLLEKVYVYLHRDPAYAAWLDRPDALSRLSTHINSYMNHNISLSQYVAYQAAGTLSVPLHPDRYFTLATEYASQDMLVQHYVNKILYVQERGQESVIIANDWLCRMDMALLHNSQGRDGLQEALVQCATNCHLPILVWHNADSSGQALIGQMRAWLEERQLDVSRIVDLGLQLNEDGSQKHATRLMGMMPEEQVIWLLKRFDVLGIPVKSLPSEVAIRKDIYERIEQQLRGRLLEGLALKFEIIELLTILDQQLGIANLINHVLSEEVKRCLQGEVCKESYNGVVERVVKEFFTDVVSRQDAAIQRTIHIHLARLQG